ncbi:Putative transport protein BB_0006 [Durusdinium trenchii]|uniref:Transport protein BB_0006 n=1 Tax=Durusdinium trenchii TaxID=1381693 RepID=A0ABP0M7J4_9DINO
MDGERRPGHLRQRSGDGRARAGSMERPQWRRYSMPPQGGYNGFKVAVAIIVFHFGVKMLVQFADLLLPFIMSLILVTVLEPVKQYTLEVLECTFLLIFSKLPCCRCCLKTSRKTAGYGNVDKREKIDLSGGIKKILLFIAIVLTILLAFRIFWFVGQIVWLSGEAVMHDFKFYKMGVGKRTSQVQDLLHRFHLEKSIPTDMKHMGDFALSLLQYVAQFLSQQVFYTLTQVSLTAIFVLFLLFSPVQRDFSPVMQGVFESMELYLKLKTFISAMMGVTNGIALAVIGLELPAAWGLLTFLANFIPNIGGPVVSIVPCVISLLDARKSLTQVTMAFFVQFFLHFNIANFVEPMVFGSSEDARCWFPRTSPKDAYTPLDEREGVLEDREDGSGMQWVRRISGRGVVWWVMREPEDEVIMVARVGYEVEFGRWHEDA